MNFEEIKARAEGLEINTWMACKTQSEELQWAVSTILKLIEANQKLKQGLEFYQDELNVELTQELDVEQEILITESNDCGESKDFGDTAKKALADAEECLK